MIEILMEHEEEELEINDLFHSNSKILLLPGADFNCRARQCSIGIGTDDDW